MAQVIENHIPDEYQGKSIAPVVEAQIKRQRSIRKFEALFQPIDDIHRSLSDKSVKQDSLEHCTRSSQKLIWFI